MTCLRRFSAHDLFAFNNVNLDYFTETYHLPFYLQYLARWPEYCLCGTAPGEVVQGYILGKVEGDGPHWHGHVTAVTVAPVFRRQKLAEQLMQILEDTTIKMHNAFFVDLFVRASNAAAILMYERFGYSVYRRVLGYYSGPSPEDALDMRKAMPRDVNKLSIVPLKRAIHPHELEFD
ncbi:hypothetical protein ACKKBG_A35165 [Auxenochlorella protothecoides x Auxenochlorella symbiontica]|uniref:N-alpha-acetyltransferase 20 n=1 Tax=Auxenochlorella protothecoides TaxID=3075 RepID=A0A087SRE5_AUXPR|nr:N-alpha-acetyltransferase 20 [Auxenochlorella protothecoides]KFM28299.1 N-alpha-acetyltransferase 20 [Auxenochlorella protothecoides]